MEISDWRKKIDHIDTQLIQLLSERARYAVEIGKLKQIKQLSVYDPAREAAVLENLAKLNPGPLSNESIQRIFLTLMEETRLTESTHSETC